MRTLLAVLLALCGTKAAEQLSGVIDLTTVTLKWVADIPSQTVLFSVSLSDKRLEWIGIGFSDHGKYNHSDLCVWNHATLRDYYVTPNYQVELDRSQDCQLVRKTRHGFEFRRRVSTCDPKDYAFENGTTQFIFAGGYDFGEPLNSSQVFKSLHYGQVLETTPPIARLERDSKEFNVLADNALIPAEVTTYWCVIKEIPQDIRDVKHHMVKMQASVQSGNEHIVHHMQVFQCQTNDQVEFSGNCNDPKKPVQSRTCGRVIAAWGMGEGPLSYPPEAGFPMGGPNGRNFIMVEIHYNNVMKMAGVRDNSGLQFHVTPSLRPHDAGIIELGLIYSDANSIPPEQDAFPITAHCVEDCTRKLPSSGIQVFASQLHSHLTGRKLWTSQYRNGLKIGELNRDQHYSPHWQHVQHIRPFIHVQPGDVLSTTCVYETRDRSAVTLGGYGIEDEMCSNFVYYFPASDVTSCKSAVDNATLHSYFVTRHSIRSSSLGIHEKYAKVDWGKEEVTSLRELFATGNLNMHCLQHDGTLFPNHPLNWTGLPQPKILAGPFGQKKDFYECPAINDV